jgi:hypothetical protein
MTPQASAKVATTLFYTWVVYALTDALHLPFQMPITFWSMVVIGILACKYRVGE